MSLVIPRIKNQNYRINYFSKIICENGDRYSFRALTTQEFDRSFNVAASRAKEQMILVHSVTLEELEQLKHS